MTALEFLLEILDAIGCWRLIVCAGPAIAAAWFLHDAVPDATWPWFVSVPVVTTAFILGLRWEWRAHRS